MSTTVVPAGSLACQKDSSLKELRTVVVKCTEVVVEEEAPAKGGGKKKKKKQKGEAEATPAPVKAKWHIVLGDTVLFPEGGGKQPVPQLTAARTRCNIRCVAQHM